MIEKLKFGTSGLRGLVSDLKDDVCARYTCAFLHHLLALKKITAKTPLLVGRDLRSSSPHIAEVVMRAAGSEGFPVINAGKVPTPALALSSMVRNVPAIMVTGSHIPDDRNGLKFYRPDGEISKSDESAIISQLAEPFSEKPRLIVDDMTLPSVDPAVLALYRERCLSILPKNTLQNMRIGVYQHSSVARDLLVDILSTLGAKIVAIERADHFIPVDTEALRECDRELALKAVHNDKLDALVSTDGDADRPLIAGSDGIFMKGDIIGLLTAKYLSADAVVTPVTSTSAVELSHFFEHCYRTSVGSPYVIAAIKQAENDGYSAIVGFEANGGVLLGSDLSTENRELKKLVTRDAMLPILAMLGFAQLRGCTLQALLTGLPQRFTASNRLTNIDTEKARHVLLDLEDGATRVHFFHPLGTIKHWDVIDGLRIIFANGDIVHFRLSGNAPELRCYSEADSQQKADTLLKWGLQSIIDQMEKVAC